MRAISIGGILTLDVLEARIDSWIEDQDSEQPSES